MTLGAIFWPRAAMACIVGRAARISGSALVALYVVSFVQFVGLKFFGMVAEAGSDQARVAAVSTQMRLESRMTVLLLWFLDVPELRMFW